MFSAACRPPLKMKAKKASADTNCTAVAVRERFAAFVPFQRQPPSFPPTNNVNSAVSLWLAACHFGGESANFAKYAVTTATFTTF